MIQKIFIHMIDGTGVWVPINARHIQGEQFEIIDNKEYDNLNTNELFEFFPGDIVELADHTFTDGTKGRVAKKLVSKGLWPERKFKEFIFKATSGQLNIDEQTAQKYHNEIDRVKNEHSTEHYIYPAIIDTAKKLNSLIKNKKE